MNKLLTILIFIISGCSSQKKDTVAVNKFVLPFIVQTVGSDTVKPFDAVHIRSEFPELIGRYRFGDTIHYEGRKEHQPQTENEHKWERGPYFEVDSLSSDGLQIIPDYKTSLAFNWRDDIMGLYYPVYVVNETFETKVFFGKDGHGFAIQEALDTTRYPHWFAIESQGYDFCGNGRFRKKIAPGEYLLFLFPKYSGSLHTSLRIRFQVGQNIFISKPFQGTIDPRQFTIDKEGWMHRSLKESKGIARNWLFYGGEPKSLDEY